MSEIDIDPVTYRRFLWGVQDSFFDPFISFQNPTTGFSVIVQAFRDNLKSAVTAGSVPFLLARTAVVQQRFNQLHAAARIRQLQPPDDFVNGKSPDLTPEHERLALKIATERMKLEQATSHFQRWATTNTVGFLESSLQDHDFTRAADDLLRQVLVMIWGSFEILATDLAVALLNAVPELAERLEATKRLKGVVSFDVLRAHKFDVSRTMGTIFFENQRLDSLPLIQEIYGSLLNDEQISRQLKNQTLWDLSQKRHLIVHRRGLVDAQYLKKTSDSAKPGTLLVASQQEILTYLTEVRDAGLMLALHTALVADHAITGIG